MFKVGDLVLLRTKELLDAADIGKSRPWWDGPFTVTACPSPNAYTLSLPRRMRCSPAVNVDRLKPFYERLGTASAPGPVLDAGQEGEHEAKLLLNRRLVRGVTRYLVLWRGHTSADDQWLRAEELTHCQEKVAEYNATAPRRRAAAGPIREGSRLPRRPPPRRRRRRRRPSCHPQVSGWRPRRRAWRVRPSSARPCSTTGRWRPGWVRGTVAARSRAAGFSHVVLRQRFCPLVGGGTLAARRGFARPGRSMGAPPSRSRSTLTRLPFSGTTVMGLLADGPDTGHKTREV